ncbi:helix-turn-helix transcriptional regulator [Canibacter zhoujuaniae]|uniref:helix-turn-helix transcriptional regulator n=1 Tax=Canibacter zhoujuaniae TaxID=2708343 RepID=UPI00141E28FE|nr:helix-turn-helix transcriptional regulator [Canibacter zhoujuaniae]
MGKQQLGVGHLNSALIDIINDTKHDKDMSLRALAAASGISLTRLSHVMRKNRPLMIDELPALCAPLGLKDWQVLRDAQNTTPKGAETTTAHEANETKPAKNTPSPHKQ